jgi:ATPase family associated with various cellular activities (AAA)
MPAIELKRLRELRRRADGLLSTLVPDLQTFRHAETINGFRRKPDSDSDPDDVNITTTCSCLMGLTLSDKLGAFYESNYKKIAEDIFAKLLSAPWMSSGLAENNAFTTTLIIRLFGFLVKEEVISTKVGKTKALTFWESHLRFSDFASLTKKLSEKKDPFSLYLFTAFPKSLQNLISSPAGAKSDKAKAATANELIRLVRTSSFYDADRFKGIPLSPESQALLLKKDLDAYYLARLNRLLLHDYYVQEIHPMEPKSLEDIVHEMSSDVELFRINEYPPAAAVLYWFVDGIDHAKIKLPKDHWTSLCTWATGEFGRQRSMVVARNAAMMDPVAMAMSACLCARLRTISNELKLGTNQSHHDMLPSTVEVERSIVELLEEQTPSGILPKYFPLFHYQDAGANFCFTFELFEAILVEFGGKHNRLISEESFIRGLERAVDWCAVNRLSCWAANSAAPYNGWNSGGNIQTLRRGQPESWATAVVHMFLWELADVLSRHIQDQLLDKYEARSPTPKWKKIDQLLDIDLWLEDKHQSLKRTLSTTIVRTFESFRGTKSGELRKRPVKKKPISALLFGPPGTSKTEVAKAIAADLGWALVEIDPSHFLQDSYQNIYVQAEKIFEDVMDMSGVVVLFDEMDALVQKRDAEMATDTESKFLTTYMLPKLAKLHDRGQLAFFMATNFQASFDDAIKRAGRFDFLLCMGPPTLRAKCDQIHVFFELDKSTPETQLAGSLIWNYAEKDDWLKDQLSLYTYGEFTSLISGIGDASSIGKEISSLDMAGFLKRVVKDSQSVGLKRNDLNLLKSLPKLKRWKSLKNLDAVDFDQKELAGVEIDQNIPAIKYMLDRKQTRRQCVKLPTKK